MNGLASITGRLKRSGAAEPGGGFSSGHPREPLSSLTVTLFIHGMPYNGRPFPCHRTSPEVIRIMKSILIAGALALGLLHPALAAEQADPGLEKARAALKKILPELDPKAVQPSPVPGIYQVFMPPQLFYISADGRYAFDGDIIDLHTNTNVSTPVRDRLRLAAIEQVGEKNMIIYGPKEAKHTITVFTDIDCGYCRKLHSEMAQYNQAGIRVRYLAYPRAGLHSNSYNKAVSVWCAKDRNKALTEAKQGKDPEPKTCDNPVAREYELGQRLGIRGTPAIVTESGQVIPGYVPADRLKAILEAEKVASKG